MKNHFPHVLFRFSLSFLLCFCLARCATIAPDPYYAGPFPRPDWVKTRFTNTADWTDSISPKEGYQQVTLTSQDPQKPIVMDLYRSSGEDPQPALLISPILGGKNRVATHFARYFSQRGYHCLIVHRPKDLTSDLRELKQLEDRLRQAVNRDRVALDWLCQQEFVQKDRIGSFGVSYGAIKNAILIGTDSRLKANVLALAGGDMASIVTHSNHKVLQRLRAYMQANGFSSEEQIEREIRQTIRTEPLRFAPFADPDTTLLILARGDKTVPRENGEILRRALGNPRTVYIPSGHYSAALFTGMFGMPHIETITREFFDRKLKPL